MRTAQGRVAITEKRHVISGPEGGPADSKHFAVSEDFIAPKVLDEFRCATSIMDHALVASGLGADRHRGSCAECICATVSRAGAAYRPWGLAAPPQLLRPGESR